MEERGISRVELYKLRFYRDFATAKNMAFLYPDPCLWRSEE
jgi:hypothetical protein